jgi:uncharacterized protein YbjT (DUF2867 family)
MPKNKGVRILVTGATGYVGSRLVPRLLNEGYSLRVLARDPQRLQGRSWQADVEVAAGDVLKAETLTPALEDIDFAYYLIHSMSSAGDFFHRDLDAAANFSNAAKQARIKRIIYLGGLGDPESQLSPHLRSRQQTGEKLKETGIPVTEFRAGIIVGSGSASFEMIRYLTERLPIMICPRWVYTRGQPIFIDDVLDYLIQSLVTPESSGETIEIGGTDILTYGEMMLGYAKVRGLRRYLIPVPVLTPKLSSYWVHWVTPIPAEIAQPLIEGLRNEVTVRNPLAKTLFPDLKPIGYERAVKLALGALEAKRVESTWTDSLAASLGDRPIVTLENTEGMITETRQLKVHTQPEAVYQAFTSLGGDNGWLFANGLWRVRGIIDRALGGVGLRRGRRHPTQIRIGDPLDFYRVEALEKNRKMLLRAEMKFPGKAWMLFSVKPIDHGYSQLTQTAYFAPKGLFGHLYWYLLYPFHTLVFSGLIRAIASTVESKQSPNLNSA